MWRLSEALPAAGTWANKPHSPSSQTPTRLWHRRPPGRQARAPRGPFSPGTEQQGRGLAQPGPGPGGETLPSGPLLLLCGPRPSPASRHSQPGHRRASHWGAGPALTGPKHPFPGGEVEAARAPASWSSARSPWARGPRRWAHPGAACSRPRPRWCPACGRGSPGGSWGVLGRGHGTGQRQRGPRRSRCPCRFITEA